MQRAGERTCSAVRLAATPQLLHRIHHRKEIARPPCRSCLQKPFVCVSRAAVGFAFSLRRAALQSSATVGAQLLDRGVAVLSLPVVPSHSLHTDATVAGMRQCSGVAGSTFAWARQNHAQPRAHFIHR
eukprot:6193714-Pleurochrysis_carterae.AAC.2